MRKESNGGEVAPKLDEEKAKSIQGRPEHLFYLGKKMYTKLPLDMTKRF